MSDCYVGHMTADGLGYCSTHERSMNACWGRVEAAEKRAADAEAQADRNHDAWRMAEAAIEAERLNRQRAEADIENQRGRANGFRKAADDALSALADAERERDEARLEVGTVLRRAESSEADYLAANKALSIEAKERDDALSALAASQARERTLREALRSVTDERAERLAEDMDHDNRDHSKWYSAVKRARKLLDKTTEGPGPNSSAPWDGLTGDSNPEVAPTGENE